MSDSNHRESSRIFILTLTGTDLVYCTESNSIVSVVPVEIRQPK